MSDTEKFELLVPGPAIDRIRLAGPNVDAVKVARSVVASGEIKAGKLRKWKEYHFVDGLWLMQFLSLQTFGPVCKLRWYQRCRLQARR